MKNALKINDLPAKSILRVDFKEKYQQIKGESNFKLELNGQADVKLLKNTTSSSFIPQSEKNPNTTEVNFAF